MIQTNLPLALRQQHIGDWYPDAINLHNLCQFNKSAGIEKETYLHTGAVCNDDDLLYYFQSAIKVYFKIY